MPGLLEAHPTGVIAHYCPNRESPKALTSPSPKHTLCGTTWVVLTGWCTVQSVLVELGLRIPHTHLPLCCLRLTSDGSATQYPVSEIAPTGSGSYVLKEEGKVCLTLDCGQTQCLTHTFTQSPSEPIAVVSKWLPNWYWKHVYRIQYGSVYTYQVHTHISLTHTLSIHK